MTDYGTDFLLEDDDIVFTADGDIKTVSGAAMVAQDIDQTIKATPESIYWDREAGSTVFLMLNDSGVDANSVLAELERVAIDDARVDPDSVGAYKTAEGKNRLEFKPLSSIKPEVLEYDVNKMGGA